MSAPKNVGASVRARLLNHAKENGSEYGLILTKYALERFLYRLSVSQWNNAFLLKGALLFDLWFDQPHRPTRDIDLLGFGPSEVGDVAAVFRNVCALACEDGVAFDATGNPDTTGTAARFVRRIYPRQYKNPAMESVSRQKQAAGTSVR